MKSSPILGNSRKQFLTYSKHFRSSSIWQINRSIGNIASNQFPVLTFHGLLKEWPVLSCGLIVMHHAPYTPSLPSPFPYQCMDLILILTFPFSILIFPNLLQELSVLSCGLIVMHHAPYTPSLPSPFPLPVYGSNPDTNLSIFCTHHPQSSSRMTCSQLWPGCRGKTAAELMGSNAGYGRPSCVGYYWRELLKCPYTSCQRGFLNLIRKRNKVHMLLLLLLLHSIY